MGRSALWASDGRGARRGAQVGLDRLAAEPGAAGLQSEIQASGAVSLPPSLPLSLFFSVTLSLSLSPSLSLSLSLSMMMMMMMMLMMSGPAGTA